MLHNFVYNYGFLRDWFDANPTVKRNELLNALNMQDYNTIKHWIDGDTMMPLTQMMRFCNYYNVPITAFFLDENAVEESVFSPITSLSIIEPTKGWPDATRKAGIKLCDPRSDMHVTSNIPSYVKTTYNGQRTTYNGQRKIYNGQRDIDNGQRTTDNGQRDIDNGQRAKDNGQRDIDNGQRTKDNVQRENGNDISHDERMRYIDIIEKLNDRVLELSELNVKLHERISNINYVRQTGTYNFVAEPETQKK